MFGYKRYFVGGRGIVCVRCSNSPYGKSEFMLNIVKELGVAPSRKTPRKPEKAGSKGVKV